MIDSYKKAQKAGETANLDAVKKAVQAYHALNDKYPQSLDDVKELIGAEMDMSKYTYDPQTGTVNLKRI
jgi:competence protein ComGC